MSMRKKIIKPYCALGDGENQSFAKFNVNVEPSCVSCRKRWRAAFLGDAFEDFEIASRNAAHPRWWQHFAEIVEAGEHARLLHSRAAAIASSRVSRRRARAMRRWAIGSDQLAKPLLSESLRSVDRACGNYYGSV